jgi:hypothetical protein
MHYGKTMVAVALAALAVGLACKKGGGSSLSVSTKSTTQATSSGGSLDLGDGLLVQRIRLAVEKVGLETSQDASQGTTGSGGSDNLLAADHGGAGGGGDPSGGDGETESDEVRVGPCLIDLSGDKLTSGSNSLVPVCSGDVPAGTYDELEVAIGPVAPADAGGVAGLADLNGKSVIVDGTFDGTAFSFQSELAVSHKSESPLTVGGSSGSNVTITVDPTGWFKGSAGVLDPTAAGNQQSIEDNIAASIQAFPDDDMDGQNDGQQASGGGDGGGGHTGSGG